ncbi:MAG: serine hydrolase domain-containing protein, partial [Vicinamibacterales bacterium]
MRLLTPLLALLLGLTPVQAQLATPAASALSASSAAQLSASSAAQLDRIILDAIAAKQAPGAVVLVGQGDQIVYEKAYGLRAVVPAPEPMTLDTVFDLASLTKVIATNTAVMTLIEQGRIRLNDPVSAYEPGFERYGKGDITIRHLMTH